MADNIQYEKQARDLRSFIEELIYENVRLYYEVELLKKNLQELKSLKAWWKDGVEYRN